MPVPFKVKGSDVDNVIPFKSNVAPLITEVAPTIVPNAEALPSLRIPPLIVVAPEYVFGPDRVKVPVPTLVKATDVAVPLLITPLYAAGLELSDPIVNIFVPTVPDE